MTEPLPYLVVTVGADGIVTAETKGAKGASCLPYIDLLENLLEATTTDSRYTDDFNNTTTTRVAQKQEMPDELGQQ
jgi:hypothetical protein